MNQHVIIPAPYLHDRWEDQVELEKSMLTMGADRMRSRIAKAQTKRDMTRLRPYRSLLKEWVLPVAEGVREWTRHQGERGLGVTQRLLMSLARRNPTGRTPGEAKADLFEKIKTAGQA